MIANFSSCEDIQIDYSNDLLYLSAADWSALLRGNYSVTGGIYALDLKQKDAKPKLVSVDQPGHFHPHGFHLYTDPQSGEKVLFVINRKQQGGSAVEIFDVVNRDTLKHRETLTYGPLISANEILGVSKNSFFITQDTKYSMGGLILQIASALSIEDGTLFHYDGKNWKTIVEGLNLANGLASSPDNKHLYVGETNKGRVRVYDGDLKTGDVHFKASYKLDIFPDNIFMDSKGDFWAAGFPNLSALFQRLQGKDVDVPVQIMRATFNGGKLTDLRRMLSTTGKDILGQTVVVPYEDKFIMSGIVTTEVRMCNLPKDAPHSDIHRNTDL